MTLERTRYSSLNPLFTKLTLVRYKIGDEQKTATGFFYKYDPGLYKFYDEGYPDHSQVYLITNKHVLIDGGVIAQDFQIYLRDWKNPTECIPHRIKLLEDDGEKIWFEHPTNDEADLAVIPLEINLEGTRNRAFRRARVGGPRATSGGDEALVLGYPFRAGDIDKFPVIRSTTISSPTP